MGKVKMTAQERPQEKIGLVFITGAGLDIGIWSKVVEGLTHSYLLVDFPHRRGSIEPRKELALADYVSHMKRQVKEWETRRFVIVAH